MKHAYLILAHDNWDQLKNLVRLLDYKDNTIFIHIDKKAKNYNEKVIEEACQLSDIFHIQRKAVFWADYSLVDATIDLLKAATSTEHFAYYHLLSGRDLPLRSQDQIHDYFDNKKQEFIGFQPQKTDYAVSRLSYYYLFLHNPLYQDCLFFRGLNRLSILSQKMIGINRMKNLNMPVFAGWQWFSITDNLALYLLNKNHEITKIFHHSLASDEMFVQTLAWNSPFKSMIHDLSDLSNGTQRCIDWERGKPYTYKIEDYEELMDSGLLFARKFDVNIDRKIVEKISNHLMK